MAVNPKTPGVYLDEIPVFPASVAAVATAVPAFVGYVEKADQNGVGIPLNMPVRITSLLEYQAIFGGAFPQNYTINLDDIPVPGAATQRLLTVTKAADSLFRLYYNMQMFYANGGGPCYIVPVGFYTDASAPVKQKLIDGLAAISKVDEPTLLVIPDAASLTVVGETRDIYDAALAQCQTLKDRFTIMDVKDTGNPTTNGASFRSQDVGADNLKYGAAYYPNLNTTLGYGVNERLLYINTQLYNTLPVPNSVDVNALHRNTELSLVNAQHALNMFRVAFATNPNLTTGLLTAVPYANAVKTVADLAQTKANALKTLLTSPQQYAASLTATTATQTIVNALVASATAYDAVNGQTQANMNDLVQKTKAAIESITSTMAICYNDTATFNAYRAGVTPTPIPLLIQGSMSYFRTANPSLYNAVMAYVSEGAVVTNPSGAMAGIYARVDNERGVWKSPANVGVRSITGPSVNVTNSQQDGLNVDPTSGKSINVVRSFTGRGTLVWGARTLAGNDNEWRYISVRRLYNFVEESIQEATGFVVFEPNTANTWMRVKGMIEAFLTNLWRDGALAGATTKEAFFVRVGLGVTMSADDILNGKMYVEVGMAAVRPAEFIILKFEHKLQES
jgi:phage tail sheath protein FI